jgi:hypothetical protein
LLLLTLLAVYVDKEISAVVFFSFAGGDLSRSYFISVA